ncbi:hypothetical protein F4821DRAFT_251413 [Hypoxylon rubiginosum]|uniref:Uncharacterized protein n=1 Tax=Hypoxylon rubiginosum TaxID=110542 RepID=A0ACC0CJ73_9PEZI|nr:hypothetical protein F4821DRAFT_251413 [Hypoxylon rubiginosum]
MSNYKSHVLPQLQELISCKAKNENGIRINAAYVTAGPFGKSTKLVPEVWKHAKATRSNPQGLYVQRTAIQIGAMVYRLHQMNITDVARNTVPRGDDRSELGLVTYDDFQTTLRSDMDCPKPSDAMLDHQDMVLFVDVEDAPTVLGEVTIGLLVSWLEGLGKLPARLRAGVNITVILLGSTLKDDVATVFETFLGNRPTHVDWVEDLQIEEQAVDDIENVTMEIIRSTLVYPFQNDDAVPDNEPGPCVLIFMQVSQATQTFYAPLVRTVGRVPQIIALSRDIDFDRWGSLVDNRPKIVCADPDLCFSLPLPNVKYVISMQTKMVRVADQASQFSCRTIPISAADVRLQRSFALKCRATYLTEWTKEWHEENRSDDEALLDGQMMRFCLEVSRVFGNLWYQKTPVPALRHDMPLIREVKRRLHDMGCLPTDDARAVLTPLGFSTLTYISGGKLNRHEDFHLANLLARIETDTTLSIPAKRVLIRVAALTNHRPVISFAEDAVYRIMVQDPEALAAIKEDSVGVGRQQAGNGQIWTELGIWMKAKVESAIIASMRNGVNVASRAEGIVKINIKAAEKAQEHVKQIEERLGMTPCLEEVVDTMLSDAERLQVLETLTRAYLHRIVFFCLDPPNEPPSDLVSLRRLRVDIQPHPIPLATIMAQSGGQPGGFYAIYQEIASNTDVGLMPLYLTLIPRSVLRKIVGDEGLSSLYSTYPIAPDKVD